MTLEKFPLALIAAFAMAACAPKEAAEEAPVAEQPAAEPVVAAPSPQEPAADACGAAGYQPLIGSNVAAITLPAGLPHRILGPNDVATMDHRPDRLNIMTDENGVIIEVKCG